MASVESFQTELLRRDHVLQPEIGGRDQSIAQQRNENNDVKAVVVTNLCTSENTSWNTGFENLQNFGGADFCKRASANTQTRATQWCSATAATSRINDTGKIIWFEQARNFSSEGGLAGQDRLQEPGVGRGSPYRLCNDSSSGTAAKTRRSVAKHGGEGPSQWRFR